MTSTPRVSVIIPAFNAEAFLADTLDSVLAQTYPNIEVIVSDDGSVDGTRREAARYGARVKYVYSANSGAPARPRNVGVRAACGELLTFIDADDLMAPDRIAAQVDFLERHPEAALVFSDYEEFGEDKTQAGGHFQTCPRLRELLDRMPDASGGVVLDPSTATELMLTENFGSSSPMLRRRVIDKVGGFDERLTSSEDFEFQFRVASAFSIGLMPQIHWYKRQHPSNMSANAERTLSRKIAVRRQILAGETVGRRRRMLKRRIAGWHAELAYFYTGRDNARAFRHILRSVWLSAVLQPKLLGRLTLDILGFDSSNSRAR